MEHTLIVWYRGKEYYVVMFRTAVLQILVRREKILHGRPHVGKQRIWKVGQDETEFIKGIFACVNQGTKEND